MSKFKIDTSNIKGDVMGGVTAGIVALPLALAFGVQSGMGAIAGLYGAIAIGVVAAIFGGTATQISGPTGPMTVVSALVIGTAIEKHGGVEAGLAAIIVTFFVAGIFQIVLGLIKVGQYVKYIPYPVISGFMSGIGVIIILLQIYPMLGHNSPKQILDVFTHFGEEFNRFSSLNWSAIGLAVVTIAIIYLFPKITKAVPSALVALVGVTAISFFMGLDVAVIGDIPSGLPEFYLGAILHINITDLSYIIVPAATLAGLGAIDSLLTSVVADNITKTKHNSNRELIGQGLGNMASSLIGGIPGAGATVRTVVNIKAGGRTRISGVTHGLLLIIVLFAATTLAAKIPLAVLAGILTTVGIGIIDYKGIKHLAHVPRSDAAVMLIVLVMTVFVDLMEAVAVGMVLASVLFMKKMGDVVSAESEIKSIKDFRSELPWKDEEGIPENLLDKVYIKHLDGPLFFGFTSQFQQMVKALPAVQLVIIRMEEVPFIDQTGLYAFEDAILDLESKGIVVVMTGIQSQPLDMLRRVNIVPDLISESFLFMGFRGCLKWLKYNFEEGEDGFEKIKEEFFGIKKSISA